MNIFLTKIKQVRTFILGILFCALALSPTSVFANAGFVPFGIEWIGIPSAIGTAITAGLSSAGDLIIEAAALKLSSLAGFLVWLSGKMLDWIVNFTIIEGVSLLNNTGMSGAINETWVVFRDLGNMFFIFIILYLAFQLILGIGSGHWRSLGWIIVMALVINFSLFFTKVIIDTSNLLALTFYEPVFKAKGGVAFTFMSQLGLQTIWNINDANSVASLFGANQTSAGNKIIVLLGATTLSVIVAFIFFALSILLIVRFAYLIFLMIFSPLAFACYVIPGARGYFGQWWNKLIQQAFFAPAVFLLLFVSFKILGGVVTTLGNLGSFGSLLVTFDSKSLPILFNFGLTIVMFLYSLTLAMNMGMVGAQTTIAWGKSLNTRFNKSLKSGGSFIGRNTVGALARYASEQEGVKRFARISPTTGQLMYDGLNKLQGVGGKGKTLADVEDEAVKKQTKFIGWATSSAPIRPKWFSNLTPEEKGEQKPEEKLSNQETAALTALKEHSGAVARERSTAQAKLSELKAEQKIIQDRLTLIKTNPLKAATDYAADLPVGKNLGQLQSELETRAQTLITSITDMEKHSNDLQESLAVAEGRKQDLIARGQSRLDDEKRAGDRKDEEQKEKLDEIGKRMGTSVSPQTRALWKKSFDTYSDGIKKRQNKKKQQQNKSTNNTGEVLNINDIDSFEDLPEEIQDLAKKALDKNKTT